MKKIDYYEISKQKLKYFHQNIKKINDKNYKK